MSFKFQRKSQTPKDPFEMNNHTFMGVEFLLDPLYIGNSHQWGGSLKRWVCSTSMCSKANFRASLMTM